MMRRRHHDETTLPMETYDALFGGNALFEHAVSVTGLQERMARILLAGALGLCGHHPRTLTCEQLRASLREIEARFAIVIPDVLASNAIRRIANEVILPRCA